LALRIDELLHGFPGEMDVLERLQQGIVASCTQTWEQVWQREAAPAFRPISRDTSGNIGAGKS
jgi:hypothetical protein